MSFKTLAPAGRRSRRLRWRLASACVLVSVAGWSFSAAADCGDGEQEDAEECDDGNVVASDGCSEACRLECAQIAGAATDHTCLHAKYGPFKTEVGSAYQGQYTEFASGIDSPHTLYKVTLAGASTRTLVTYWPTQRGTYAFYLKEPYPLEVRTPSASVPVRIEHAVAACEDPSSLTWVRVYDLTDEAPYNVVFGPLPETSVVLAVERLESFLEGQYKDVDGDGWGDDDAGVWAWCTLSTRVSLTGDCDDRTATTHPNAPEVCNGVDDDCNVDTPDVCTPDAGEPEDAGAQDATAPGDGGGESDSGGPGDAGSIIPETTTFDAGQAEAGTLLDTSDHDSAPHDAAPPFSLDAGTVASAADAAHTGPEPTRDAYADADANEDPADDDDMELSEEPAMRGPGPDAGPRPKAAEGCALRGGPMEATRAWLVLLLSTLASGLARRSIRPQRRT